MAPPSLNSYTPRDHPIRNHAWTQAEAVLLLANDNVIKYKYDDLTGFYSSHRIEFYDPTTLGFQGIASVLISEIFVNFPIRPSWIWLQKQEQPR